jgi:GT2 family glycosyltransferase/glycosyltransferase involved in cell wall biosynthesis
MIAEQPVTVIVPVYRGVDEVEACIGSVIRHGAVEPFQLVVIDDGSPEPEVGSYLDSLAADPPRADGLVQFTVLHNEQNLGFVGTVNRGLTHASGHVVILNADTVVTSGWLDRLHQAATASPDIATVTPLTNFGSICTLPDEVIEAFALDGPDPEIDACAAFVARHGLGERPEVITGVGFCMFITRDALDACGPLDQETFGRGYGEEVDFCMRATRLGFAHLVEDQTFVYHHGAVSFGADREAGLQQGSVLIRSRYPFFRPTNRLERREDPLKVTFTSLRLGLAERRDERPHVLHLLHSAPSELGGTEKHLAALMAALRPEVDFSVLHPVPSGFVLHTYWVGDDGALIEHEFLLPGGPRRVSRVRDEHAATALRTTLDLFTFDAVHIQNLIGHSLSPLSELRTFDGAVVCSVRDPFLACPSHALLYRGNEFCGIPEDLSLCRTCLPETREVGLAYLNDFRHTVAENMDVVDTWVFASRSAADLMLRVYDIEDERTQIVPHGAIIDPAARRTTVDVTLIRDEPLRVAFIGLGRAKKGLGTVNWLADELEGSTIEIHHFGNLVDQPSSRVHTHGPYDNELLSELLDDAGIQVVLLPGQVSETFGHVMTEALLAGRPVIGSYYGALGERIRATQAGWTIDPSDPPAILALLRDLDACRDELSRATVAALDVEIQSVADTADRYSALYLKGRS